MKQKEHKKQVQELAFSFIASMELILLSQLIIILFIVFFHKDFVYVLLLLQLIIYISLFILKNKLKNTRLNEGGI